jgi:hypothetical protein
MKTVMKEIFFLCGSSLRNNCNEEEDEQEDDCFIDMEFFCISFDMYYIVVVMMLLAILYINSYWRRRWLYFIENCMDSCDYYVVASFRKFSNFRR